MRALILALSILAIVDSAHFAKAGLSSTPREAVTTEDAAISADEAASPQDETTPKDATSLNDANAETEKKIGLNKAKRRAVQRGLTRLGFETKASGTFDDSTRATIARWQEDQGYAATGYLNTAQHKALRDAVKVAAKADRAERQERRRGGRARASRGGGNPISAIGGAVGGVVGGVVGGIFRR